MQEQLNALQAKPRRSLVEQQVEKAEQRAFDRSYKETRKQIAQAEGAAAGVAAASAGEPPAGAIERARARALGQVDPPAASPIAAPSPAPSGRFIQTPEGDRIPEEVLSLPPEQQKQFKQLLAERKQQTADENTVATVANGVLDALESERKARKTLEGQVATLLTLVEQQQRQIAAINTTVEVAKSDALSEQQAGLSQQVANLSAIRAEAGLEAAQHQRAREDAAADHRDQLEAQATAIDALSGSVKSTTALMQERSNAVESQVAAMEPRVQKLDVSIQELEGKTDAWTDPITRAEVNNMATTAVAEQWQSQLPALVDAVAEELQAQFPAGVHGPRVESRRVRQLRADATRIEDQQEGRA